MTKLPNFIEVNITLPERTIIDLLVDANEISGCMNYWGEFEQTPYYNDSLDLPVIVREMYDSDDINYYLLDQDVIERGLSSMAIRSPQHFADIISGNTDIETADVFVQYCLFDEIVYG